MSEHPERLRAERGGEARRALIATALGVALGVLVTLFSRRDEERDGGARRWRVRSAN